MTPLLDHERALYRIVDACREWNAQAQNYLPEELAHRSTVTRGLATICKALVGFFVSPPVRASARVVIFQGLRSRSFFHLFAEDQIYILGSWAERDYARAKGYGFIPVFPVENALRLAIYRNAWWPARLQFARWRSWIAGREVRVFLYEDSQPMGAFLALLSNHDNPRYRAACIQHGHFCQYVVPYRPEGQLTEYNLVWDGQQGDLISRRPEKTRVIGLPYEATARASDGLLRILFVGVGTISSRPKSLRLYGHLARLLRATYEDVQISYRPHPNEFGDHNWLAECQQIFGSIDRSDKLQLLEGPRRLFVGEVSSLLYEAKCAGHVTAFVPIDPRCIPVECHDFMVDPMKLECFVSAITANSIESPSRAPNIVVEPSDPVIRFAVACQDLKLI